MVARPVSWPIGTKNDCQDCFLLSVETREVIKLGKSNLPHSEIPRQNFLDPQL